MAGDTSFGVGNVPQLPPGVEYVEVAAGSHFQMARRSDGQVVAWPNVSFPAPPPGVVYVEIDNSSNGNAMIARRSDGQCEALESPNFPFQFRPQPLDPGLSYVEVSANTSVVARVGPESTYVSFANGCAGSAQAARLVPLDTPRIGDRLEVNVFDLPHDVAFVLFGFARIPPVSLAPLGMPGCQQHVRLDAAVFVSGQLGVAKYHLPIPNDPGLVGLHFYNQAIVLDLQAGNALGAVVSDAAEGVVGHR